MPITGTAGNDSLITTGIGETVNALGGDDHISDNGSASIIDGGTGNDTLTITRTAAPFTLSFTDGAANNPAASDGTTIANVETLFLITGSGNDNVTLRNMAYHAGSSTSTWFAGGGTDTVTYDNSGNATNLLVSWLPGEMLVGVPSGTPNLYDAVVVVTDVENSNVVGGTGDDRLNGGDYTDHFVGGTGNDQMSGYGGNDLLEGGPGDDVLVGGDGVDTVSYQNAAGAVSVSLALSTQSVGGGEGTDMLITTENLVGSGFDDTLTGNTGDNELSGLAGNDRLGGDDGLDTLNGGAGNDTLDGGINVDTAKFAGNSWAYTITQTSAGHFTIAGLDGSDTLSNVEYAKFDDQTIRLLPGSGTTVNFAADPSTYMAGIRDFDGNDLGGDASWKLIGTADVNGDGSAEHILFNRAIGRWAEVGTEADGKTYFANNSWAGDTRVVGIYIDPLVANGTVVRGSDTDSQRRFQNDLQIDNIKSILGQGDYNHDGLQEIYFSLTDGTAYLHAYMHADGNIQYANYQNKQQVIDYLTANGVASSTWSAWFPASQAAPDTVLTDFGAGNSVTANPLGQAG